MRKLARAFLIALALLVGAGLSALFLTRRPIDPAEGVTHPIEASGEHGTDVEVSFSILPTATVTAPEAVMFEGGSWFKERRMDHSAVLICHPKALILFDTGLGRDIDNQFREFPLFNRMALRYEKLRAAADVIAADNPCPDRPLIIIPSHLHWDHAGGIEDFPNAEVWIQDAELRQARTGGTAQGFLPAQIDAESIKWHPFTFSDQPYEQYRQSLDVFDDGSLILVPMAGHTAGSVGLFLTTARARYFFTGDTTWSREGFSKPAHKFAAARAIVDLDPGLLEKEIADVHQLMLRDPDLLVIPAHDAAAYPEGAIYPGWTDGQN